MANWGSRRRSGVEASGEGVEKAVSFALIGDDGESDRESETLGNNRGGTSARDTHRARQRGAGATLGAIANALLLCLVLHFVIVVGKLR
eukprot:3202657-Heterocapsa_arctica.AAC.1